jgi:hypothetical protein
MYTSHSILSRTSSRNHDHVPRTIVACRSGAAQALATEDFHQAAIRHADRMQLVREAGIASAGIGSLLASLRRLTGTALIRFGERLHGRPVVSPVTNPVTTV